MLEKSFSNSQITVDINTYTKSNTKMELDITTASDIFWENNSKEKETKHTKLKDEVDNKLKEILKNSPNNIEIMGDWIFVSNGQNTNNGQNNNNNNNN